MITAAPVAHDVERLLEAIAAEGLLRAYSHPGEMHPSSLVVALIHAVHDAPPAVEGAAVVAQRYAKSVGIDRVHDDPWSLPPRDTQHTLDDFAGRFESVGLADMQCTLGSHSPFPGTDLSRVAYVAAAAKALRSSGIAMLQDLHAAEPSTLASVFATLPGEGRGVVRRLLACTAHDDWVLADEPVRDFVASAIAAPKVSRCGARRLVRVAAHEILVAPRYLDLRIWLAGTANGTRFGVPGAFHDDAKHAKGEFVRATGKQAQGTCRSGCNGKGRQEP